jgi:hypothetical protein
MNERISELEALCWEDIPCVPYWDGMPGKHELYTTEKVFNKEKFAELIVEECRTVVTEVYRNTPLELCGPLLTADEKIAEHFYRVKE